ncbi:MAG: GMC family oxidoreductase N-terminal domain-containing protein, partial [Bacteroidota bacterium]
MANDFDVIIIGSGAGGGATAYALAQTGKNILILERGTYLPREQRNADPHFIFGPDGYKADVKWQGPEDSEQQSVHPMVYHRVGGNTKLYGALLHRQRPEDFTEQRHKGGISPGWCVGYDAFEPYYLMAEHAMKLHGNDGEDKTAGRRSGAFPFRGVPHEGRIAEVVRDLQGLGLNIHHSNLALNQDIHATWDRLREQHGPDTPFPAMTHTKADAETALVQPALRYDNVTLWTNSRVDRLIEENGKITRIELEKDGEALELSADLIVLSCGAINSAALLLKSGVANSSDQVGRNFTKHNQSGISCLDPSKPNDVHFQKTLGCHDFYHGSPEHDYPMGTIQLTGKAHYARLTGDYA